MAEPEKTDERPWTRGRALLLLIGGCMAGAIAFGLVLDQITIRISPEYFTIYHPRIIASDDLTLTALAWGVTATWWVGLLLGVYLTLVAISGDLPIATRRDILTTIFVILGGTVLAVVVMYIRGLIKAPTSAAFTTGDNHAITRAYILHSTSYLAPIPLAIGMSIWMIVRRYKRNLESIRAGRT